MATTKTTESSSKKTPAKKAAPKVAAEKPAKTTSPKTPRKKVGKSTILTSEERYKLISTAAYYIAEKHGFGDQHLDYWLAAEKEVDAKLNA